MKKVVDILTSFETPQKVNAIGNEAIARGALEAGVNGVFSYPGTPSTEISEIFNLVTRFIDDQENFAKHPTISRNKLYFEYSINEKVALEKAIAFSIGNKSSMCVMKNVGMNVASDALMSITYQTLVAPLVVIVCDDPGCHSSSNEQDSRYWGNMASVPVFNPVSAEDAYEMTRKAFKLSEELRIPVIVRTTTRVSHTRGMLHYNEIADNDRPAFFERLPEHINIPARTAQAHQKLLDKLHSETVDPYFKTFNRTYFEKEGAEDAIISSGVSTAYLLEVVQRNELENSTVLFDLGLIFPFPENDVINFLKKGIKRVLIVEELDPIIENAVRSCIQKYDLNIQVLGKNFGGLTQTGEYDIKIIDWTIRSFLGVKTVENKQLGGTDVFTNSLPPRPPALCSGCPHRATYYSLKLIVPREDDDIILCGDIGCSGLGALPPLKMIDTINHMGMSISMAQGLSQAMKDQGGKVVAMLGDGTFFHSGITSLINAVYTRSNMMVIIFDNRTIGMTGHQDHPGATHLSKYQEIEIVPLLKGMGIEYVETLMPFDIRDTYKKIKDALKVNGVSVLVSKAPCVFLPDYKNFVKTDSKIVIDPAKCNTCHNHSDLDIHCSKAENSKSSLTRAIAKINGEVQIDAKEQACPANICNHGFFNSILEKDYKTALNLVRDKLLFSRTCGDICHRPCELFSEHEAAETIPIKELKRFVSGIDENFKDFSMAFERVKKAEKKNKHIAIIGAGPSGLSAAYDLIREGYEVSIYEKEGEAGGLIKFVIPDFRMDKSGFDFEVSQLEKMGVKFHFNTILGTHIDLDTLSEENDGVIVAIGLNKAKKLDVLSNISETKQIDALNFLVGYNLRNLPIKTSSKVLVVGGGNSAIDAARAAKQFDSTNAVYLVCIEKEVDMPAFTEEITHAKEEGVLIYNNSYIDSCQENGHIEVVLNAFDTKDFKQKLDIDYIVVAIGQSGNNKTYKSINSNNLANDNRIKVDPNTGFSNYKNVFVAGDLCDGNHMSLIGAIGSGKRAAIGIRQLLEDYPHAFEGIETLLKLNDKRSKGNTSIGVNLTSEIQNYISKFNLFQSCEKCNHCIANLGCPAMIKVDGKIIIDQPQCTKCGLCIDVCPNDAIQWEKIVVEEAVK